MPPGAAGAPRPPGRLAGAEPFRFEGTSGAGVLLLHGFTGSPQSLRGWGEALHRAGLSVDCPLLPGHGTSWQDLQRTAPEAWTSAASGALDQLLARCDRVAVAALSFGAVLALHLAATRPADVRGVVLVNPYLYDRNPRLRLLPVLKHVLRTSKGVGSDIADPAASEVAYDRVPLKALAGVRRLQASVRDELGRVRSPVLVLFSPNDHVADPGNAPFIAGRVGSGDVTVVPLERSFHVATLDHDRDLIAERSVAFVRRVTAAG